MPPLPEQWPVELKEEALAKQARRSWVEHAPQSRAVPRKPWITEECWTQIRAHAQAKRILVASAASQVKQLLGVLFHAWAAARPSGRPASVQRLGEVRADAAAADHRAAWITGWCGHLARSVRRVCRQARSQWVAEAAREAAKKGAAGDAGAIWGVVRQALGRRRRSMDSSGVICQNGSVAAPQEEVASAWQGKFLDEFWG